MGRATSSACAGGLASAPLTGQALQKFVMQTLDERLVRAEGLEPPQLSSLEPKSSASTSSATPADSIMSGREAAGGRAYNMGLPVRSKKMAVSGACASNHGGWTYPAENGPHRPFFCCE